MPTLQRRPRQALDDDDADDHDHEQARPRQRRRRTVSPRADSDDEDRSIQGSGDRDESTEAILVKKLVRYALACEYSRTSIRRDGIKDKVLDRHGRLFKKVFDGAQKQLRAVFGMEMVELPPRDKVTMSVEEQRRAAKSQAKAPATSNNYILVSRLPDAYRSATIIMPSRIQSVEKEAAYIALYSLIVTLISLHRGELSDPKLRRYLQRMNASVNTPIEKTDLLLQRLVRQGYIVKTTDKTPQSDEGTTTWHLGPRGRQEISKEGMANMVREVYGAAANEEIERRLQESFGVKERKPRRSDAVADGSGALNPRDLEDFHEEEDGG